MRVVTNEIKLKLKKMAIEKLKDGKDVEPPKSEVDAYTDMLCRMYENNLIEIVEVE